MLSFPKRTVGGRPLYQGRTTTIDAHTGVVLVVAFSSGPNFPWMLSRADESHDGTYE